MDQQIIDLFRRAVDLQVRLLATVFELDGFFGSENSKRSSEEGILRLQNDLFLTAKKKELP